MKGPRRSSILTLALGVCPATPKRRASRELAGHVRCTHHFLSPGFLTSSHDFHFPKGRKSLLGTKWFQLWHSSPPTRKVPKKDKSPLLKPFAPGPDATASVTEAAVSSVTVSLKPQCPGSSPTKHPKLPHNVIHMGWPALPHGVPP